VRPLHKGRERLIFVGIGIQARSRAAFAGRLIQEDPAEVFAVVGVPDVDVSLDLVEPGIQVPGARSGREPFGIGLGRIAQIASVHVAKHGRAGFPRLVDDR
jgi:hypothetical protein